MTSQRRMSGLHQMIHLHRVMSQHRSRVMP
jgi:hypothetical protein